jgi:GNAT superfamily N-acetyltransferase
MTALGRLTYLRPCVASDESFVYDVFATTWQSEVAALPNQNLARHVLRIQHIAQERRFAARYPDHERFIVLAEDGGPAGRLYVYDDGARLHVVDLTLMPRYRSQGLGTRIFRDLLGAAAVDGRSVTSRVSRKNRRATDLFSRLGFRLVAVDDLDNHFEWSPPGSSSAMKESLQGMRETEQHSVRVRRS